MSKIVYVLRNWIELPILLGGLPPVLTVFLLDRYLDRTMIDATMEALGPQYDAIPDMTAKALLAVGIFVFYFALCLTLSCYFVSVIRQTELWGRKQWCEWLPAALSALLVVGLWIFCLTIPLVRDVIDLDDRLYRASPGGQTTMPASVEVPTPVENGHNGEQPTWTDANRRSWWYDRPLEGVGVVTALLGAVCAVAIGNQAKAQKEDPQAISLARSRLLHSLLGMTVLLVASVLLVVLTFQIHREVVEPLVESGADSWSPVDKYDQLARHISVLCGAVFTAILMGIYAPLVFQMRGLQVGRGAPERSSWNRESIEIVLATLFPLLTGILAAFLGGGR